jgi:hypothetical protein
VFLRFSSLAGSHSLFVGRHLACRGRHQLAAVDLLDGHTPTCDKCGDGVLLYVVKTALTCDLIWHYLLLLRWCVSLCVKREKIKLI